MKKMVKSLSLAMALLMVLGSVPVILGDTSSRADVNETEPNNSPDQAQEVSGGDVVHGSLGISSSNDVYDWYRVMVNRGQVLTASMYHVDWNSSDPTQYNFNIVVYGPTYYWVSFLQTRWEVASVLSAFTGYCYILILPQVDNQGNVATDPGHYDLYINVSDPEPISVGSTDQETLNISSGDWFHWYKINANPDQGFMARITNPNGANYDMDMYGIWNRGIDSNAGYQGYQPFYINQTRADSTAGNTEGMGARKTDDMDLYVSIWNREGSGQYTFQVQNAMIPADGDSTPTSARMVEKKATFTQHIDQAWDHFDWYKFHLEAGQTVDIIFTLLNDKYDYYNLTIWDENLNYLYGQFNTEDGNPYRAPDPQHGDPGNKISNAGINIQDWSAPNTGYYYIMVMPIHAKNGAGADEPMPSSQDYRLYIALPDHGPEQIKSLPDITIDEDETYSGLNLNDYFSDPEGDVLTFSVVSKDSTHVKVTLDAGGNVTIKPDANWFGVCNITFEASDGDANIGEPSIQDDMKVTVNSVNDLPFQKESFSDVVMFENSTYNLTLKLDEVFGDIDDELTYTYSGASHIQVTIREDNSIMLSAPDLWFGDETITFTARDSETSISTTVNVTVQHRNHAPSITVPEEITLEIEEDGMNDHYNVEQMFTDPDMSYANDYLNFSVDQMLIDSALNITIDSNKNLVIKTLPNRVTQGEEFEVVAVDTYGASATVKFIVDILPVNDPPELINFTPAGDQEIMEGESLKFTVNVKDIDTDPRDLEYSWYVNNELQEGTNVMDELFTFITGHTEEDQGFPQGDYEIRVSISDGENTIEHTWNLTVIDVNQPPENAKISLSPKVQGNVYKEGETIVFSAGNATDPDGDPLYYKWVDKSTNTTLSEDQSFETSSLKPGTHVIVLYISDGKDEINTTVTITVKKKAEKKNGPGFEALVMAAAVAAAAIALRGRRRT